MKNNQNYNSISGLQLCLTLVLGVLGAIILPVRSEFVINIFPKGQAINLITWLVVLFLGVLILYYRGKVKPHIIIYVAMQLVLIMAFCFFLRQEKKSFSIEHIESFYWQCGIFLFLILAGILTKIVSMKTLNPLLWVRELLRGLAIAILAPLLLYASRTVSDSTSLSIMQRVSKKAFFLFPFVMVITYILPFSLEMNGFWHRFMNFDILGCYNFFKYLGLRCISFTVWGWIGCALIFVLSPWFEYPEISKSTISIKRKMFSILSILVIAALMIILISIGEGWILAILFHPLFIFGGTGVLLTIFLFPWPEYPYLPRMKKLSPKLRFSPLATFIFIAIPAISLSLFTNKFLFYILSGELFTTPFNSSIVRGALDQSGFNKGILFLIYFSAQVFPFVAIARWISNRNTRFGYWAFAIPIIYFCVSLLSIHTLIFVGLLKYIYTMGFTPLRIWGIFYGVIVYIIVLGYFWWAIYPSKKKY